MCVLACVLLAASVGGTVTSNDCARTVPLAHKEFKLNPYINKPTGAQEIHD